VAEVRLGFQARLFRQFAGALGLGISQLSPQLNHLLLKQGKGKQDFSVVQQLFVE